MGNFLAVAGRGGRFAVFGVSTRKVPLTRLCPETGLGMGPGERPKSGRERPCGVLPERWPPHRPPAPLQFRSQAVYALYLRHAGGVGCTNSKERAEAATRRKQLHKTQLAAPLEAQSQVSPTWLRRATGSQSEASCTWGRGHSLPHSHPSQIPRGTVRARAERSQRGRREQVRTAERERT